MSQDEEIYVANGIFSRKLVPILGILDKLSRYIVSCLTMVITGFLVSFRIKVLLECKVFYYYLLPSLILLIFFICS